MWIYRLPFLFILLFSCSSLYSAHLWVDSTNSDGSGTVNDPNDPYIAISDAVTASANGDVIWIASGTYSYQGGVSKDLTYIGIGKVVWDSGSAYAWLSAHAGSTFTAKFENITFIKHFNIVVTDNDVIQTINYNFYNCLFTYNPGSTFLGGFSILALENIPGNADTFNVKFDNCSFIGRATESRVFGVGNGSTTSVYRYGTANTDFYNCVFDKGGATNIFSNHQGNVGDDQTISTWNRNFYNCSFSTNSSDQSFGALGTVNTSDNSPNNTQTFVYRNSTKYDYRLNSGTTSATLTNSTYGAEIGIVPGTNLWLYDQPNVVATFTGNFVYIDSSATGANNGTSWEDAYSSTDLSTIIPSGVSVGDIILIKNSGTNYTVPSGNGLNPSTKSPLEFRGVNKPIIDYSGTGVGFVYTTTTSGQEYLWKNLELHSGNVGRALIYFSDGAPGSPQNNFAHVINCLLYHGGGAGGSYSIFRSGSNDNWKNRIDMDHCAVIRNTNDYGVYTANTTVFELTLNNNFFDQYGNGNFRNGASGGTLSGSNNYFNETNFPDGENLIGTVHGSVADLNTFFRNYHDYIVMQSSPLSGGGSGNLDIGTGGKFSYLLQTNFYWQNIIESKTSGVTTDIPNGTITIPSGEEIETYPVKIDQSWEFSSGNVTNFLGSLLQGSHSIFVKSSILESDLSGKNWIPLPSVVISGRYFKFRIVGL